MEVGKLNVRDDSKKYSNFEHDIRISRWGKYAGKILKDGENYCCEYKIKIHNEDLKDKISSVEVEISEVTEVIRVAKECIF